MKFNPLAHTGIQLPEICLGTMTFGEQNSQPEAFDQLNYALENGLYFDIAEHADKMAQMIHDAFAAKGNLFLYDSPTNQQFPILKNADLEKLSEHFVIVAKDQEIWKPQNKFEFGMYLDGSFYALFYKKENHQQASILDNLDAQILYDKVLFPLLGIEDLRNDERIDYIPGKQSISVIKDLIDEGEFEVGFMLMTPKNNIFCLYNQKTADEGYLAEKSLKNHYDVDIITNAFFGTQFESVSPEVLSVYEVDA